MKFLNDKNIKNVLTGSKKITLNLTMIITITGAIFGSIGWYFNSRVLPLETNIKIMVDTSLSNMQTQLLNDNSKIKLQLTRLDENDKQLVKSFNQERQIVEILRQEVKANAEQKVNKEDMYEYIRADTQGIYHSLNTYQEECCDHPIVHVSHDGGTT